MKHKSPHKFVRVELGVKKYIVYKCVLSGCETFKAKDIMIGSEFLCFKCDAPARVESDADLISKLHCKNCRKIDEVSLEEVEEVIDKVANESQRIS